MPKIRVDSFRAGCVLHRDHDRAFGPTLFNPGKGQPSRFASFTATNGAVVPTLYAATSREASVHETLFHDIEAVDLEKTVRRGIIDTRVASEISPRRDIHLATLFTPDLMRLGLTRGQLIDTPKTAYAQTVLWARAIHAAEPTIDGLLWTSRRCDPDLCLVLFGDRIADHDFDVLNSLSVARDARLIAELQDFAGRAGITIIV